MPYVSDTHCLIWHLTDDVKLSAAAKEIFVSADNAGETIIISCISLFEVLLLTEKKKIQMGYDKFIDAFSLFDHYRIEPVCLPIINQVKKISRDEIKDPWDRIIAATSMHLNLPLISKDRKLAGLGIPVIN
jgi:PIN domain nuclease of toxin-antitoxin system